MTILALNVMQITDDKNHKLYPNWIAYRDWGAFLFYITTYRRISLSKENFLILALSEYGWNELHPKENFFGLFRAPYSTLILHITNSARAPMRNKLFIYCVSCCHHASYHLTKQYFTGSTGNKVRSHMNIRMYLCKRHVHTLKTVIENVNGKLECSHFSWKRIYHQPRNLQQCFESRVVSFRILGDVLNLTSSNGGKAQKRGGCRVFKKFPTQVLAYY